MQIRCTAPCTRRWWRWHPQRSRCCLWPGHRKVRTTPLMHALLSLPDACSCNLEVWHCGIVPRPNPVDSLCVPPAERALRNWRRAADAIERERGLSCTAEDFPHELAGLSKRFVTRIVTVIGESCGLPTRPHRASPCPTCVLLPTSLDHARTPMIQPSPPAHWYPTQCALVSATVHSLPVKHVRTQPPAV